MAFQSGVTFKACRDRGDVRGVVRLRRDLGLGDFSDSTGGGGQASGTTSSMGGARTSRFTSSKSHETSSSTRSRSRSTLSEDGGAVSSLHVEPGRRVVVELARRP